MNRLTLRSAASAALLLGCYLLAAAAPSAAPAQPPALAQTQVPASVEAPVDSPASASAWSRLWRTADQRGQALLQRGDAAGAVKEFSDPQHKAHAALQAGDYASAAQTLTGIDNAEAQYNRGNALAHTGDLQAAIKAYDAALKLDPQHADAKHNRDIVAAALEKQKQQDDKKDQNKKDGDKKDGDKKDGSKEDGKSGAKPDDQKDDKSGGKPGDKPADNPAAKAGDKAQPQTNAKPGERPASAPQPGNAPAQAAAPSGSASSPKDDAAQARRDAESALNNQGTQTNTPKTAAAPAQPGASGPNRAGDASKPVSEKQIAQEQWLRAIPEDPGGLLRRKFLIEHMLRQQGQKP